MIFHRVYVESKVKKGPTMKYTYIVKEEDYLAHYGVKGQKWGVRRYQNLDGSLTSAGRIHYGVGDPATPIMEKKRGVKESSEGAPKDLVDTATAINGGSDIFIYGYNRNNNCAFCSASYEARRRGMDVQAQASINGVLVGNKLGYFKELYTNYKPEMTKTHIARKVGEMNKGMTDEEFDAMADECIKEGKNSRGQLGIYWKSDHPNGWYRGGHATNYEVKDGVFYIVDPQVGRVYSGKDAKEYMAKAAHVRRTRTDNLKMSEKLVKRKYAEKHTGDYGGINKAAKSFYKWNDVNDILSLVTGVSIVGGTGLSAATGMLGFLAVPAASLAANMITSAGKEITREQAIRNYRIAYQELADKWKREGREQWYTTETEKLRGLT